MFVNRWLCPVIVMPILGLGAACAEEVPVATVPEEYLRFDADGVVFDMTHRFTQDGRLQALVMADTAIQWNDSTAVAMRGVNLRVYNEDGTERAHVTAVRGTLDTRTEAMVAHGDVVLIIPSEQRRIETQQLRYDPRGGEIVGDSAFVMTLPGSRPMRGRSFRSDLEFRNFRIVGEGG